MNRICTYFFEGRQQTREISWFRNFLYLFVVYKMVTYLAEFEALFSENKMIFQSVKHVNFISDAIYYLNNNYSVFLAKLFIGIAILFAVIGVAKKSNYITNFVLWFCIINISNFLYAVQTGGDYMLNQMLLFNCFLLPGISQNIFINAMKTCLHNLALIIIKIQVCIAYFIAAYYKLTDVSWLNGSAVYDIFQIPEFSNYMFRSLSYPICVIITYLTLLYQLFFSVLVWFRSFKIYLFTFGIIQHLLIAFGVGLLSFGFIMIICYVLFLKFDYNSSTETK